MIKKLLVTMLTLLNLSANEIPLEHTTLRNFESSIGLNAKIIQLSNASGSVMSHVGGHIEKYFVKAGQSVKKGQKLLLIESIYISKMSAEFVSLKKQLFAQKRNYDASKSLYEKGMTSLVNLNQQSIKQDELLAKITSLESQLNTLSIDTKNLNSATSNLILYAHSDGIVSSIVQPLHSTIQEDTPIIFLVKKQAFYLKSFLPISYASRVKIGQKITLDYDGKSIVSHITQILPKVDETTQRIVLLSSIDANTKNLFINSYVKSTLYFSNNKKFVAIKKSALSFFNNEWVVFMPKEEHNEHDEHGHDGLQSEHKQHEHDGLDSEHKEHDGHDNHEDEEQSYTIRVVEVVAQDENYVGVLGLELGEEYVSAKSYYVKSMLLKSSLGGHGH